MSNFFRGLSRTFLRRTKTVSTHGRRAAAGTLSGAGVVFSFAEADVKRPEHPVQWPKPETLSPEYLIRQACTLSSDQVPVLPKTMFPILHIFVSFSCKCGSKITNLYKSLAY
jgi:hypothetical protein